MPLHLGLVAFAIARVYVAAGVEPEVHPGPPPAPAVAVEATAEPPVPEEPAATQPGGSHGAQVAADDSSAAPEIAGEPMSPPPVEPAATRIAAATVDSAVADTPEPGRDGPTFGFGGQYRLNGYADLRTHRNVFGDDHGVGVRPRFRPTFYSGFADDKAWAQIQLNIAPLDGAAAFDMRYAELRYEPRKEIRFGAGLLPIADRFGDTLFSSAWGFNPIAAELSGEVGDLSYRVAGGRLRQGDNFVRAQDDLDLYVADLDYKFIGVSSYGFFSGNEGVDFDPFHLYLYGLRFEHEIRRLRIGAFGLGSSFQRPSGDVMQRAHGVAGKAEAAMRFDATEVAVLALYSTGDRRLGEGGRRSFGFVSPLSLIGNHGYWGYTGRFTVQGPTDAGIDDPLNIDGGSYGNQRFGRGMASAQVKVTHDATDRLRLYGAAGWFALTDGGLGPNVGIDTYAQASFRLAGPLVLDVGADYAYFDRGHPGATTGATTRHAVLVFSRLQLEWDPREHAFGVGRRRSKTGASK